MDNGLYTRRDVEEEWGGLDVTKNLTWTVETMNPFYVVDASLIVLYLALIAGGLANSRYFLNWTCTQQLNSALVWGVYEHTC
jgi:hypothetical protein